MKPEADISKLVAAISNFENIKTGLNRAVISYTETPSPVTLIMHEGAAALYRINDHLLMANMKAPMLLGFNINSFNNRDVYLKVNGFLRYEIVERSVLKAAVNDLNLWESLANLFMYTDLRILESHFSSVGNSSYSLIKNNLIDLMAEHNGIREEITACDYIVGKTLLSRSLVMKILSDLKKGGYIEIKRGMLLDINRLPDAY
jgi:hypothetical protein